METRDQILKIAGELLAKRGYWGVSMQDIADSLGITKAALYYHFPSKQALTRALLEQTYEEFFSALEEAGKKTSNPAATLLASVDAYITFALKKPQINFLLFTETEELDEGLRAYLESVHREVKDFFKVLIGANLAEERRANLSLNSITEALLGILSNLNFIKRATPQKSAQEITQFILPNEK